MAARVDGPNSSQSISDQPPRIFIKEDSTLLKIAAAIPLIGMPVSVIQEHFLSAKIVALQEPSVLSKLISVKNDYKKSAIIRNLISAALVIAGIAKGILKSNFLISAFILTGAAAFNVYLINQNEKVIHRLKLSGFGPGLIVH